MVVEKAEEEREGPILGPRQLIGSQVDYDWTKRRKYVHSLTGPDATGSLVRDWRKSTGKTRFDWLRNGENGMQPDRMQRCIRYAPGFNKLDGTDGSLRSPNRSLEDRLATKGTADAAAIRKVVGENTSQLSTLLYQT